MTESFPDGIGGWVWDRCPKELHEYFSADQLADPPSNVLLYDHCSDLDALEKDFRESHKLATRVEAKRIESLDKAFEQFALECFPSYRTPFTLVSVWYRPHRMYLDTEGKIYIELL